MKTNIQEIIQSLQNWAPPALQEAYDNSGLQIGNPNQACTGILVCLDFTEEVLKEALEKNCNLIISHHPLIFKGIKSISGKNLIERCIIKAIKENLVLYTSHTNLDSVIHGVSKEIADRLQLSNQKILSSRAESLVKLYTYVPLENKDELAQALFDAGAGNIGEYSECSFQTKGKGTFKPSENANPTIGETGGPREEVEEVKLEVIIPFFLIDQVVHALKEAHPYEEVAYELIALKNNQNDFGFGVLGELEQEMELKDFLERVKKNFNLKVIKHTNSKKISKIKTVALCGGSGAFLIGAAKAQKADIYITGDLKYHDYFLAEDDIILADIGHFESEQFTIQLICRYLQKNFSKFAIHATSINTNPINYYI